VVLVSSEPSGIGVPRESFPPIQRLLLRDAALHWQVTSTGAELVLSVPVLSAGPLEPGVQGLVEADIRVAGRRPELAGDLSLTASLAPAADLSSVRIAPLRITGDDLSIAELADLPLALAAQMTWQPMSATLGIDDLSVELGALRLFGQGDVAPGPRGSRLTAQLAIAPLDLRRWLDAHLAGPIPGETQTLRRVAGQGLIELEDGQLALSQVRISVDDSNAAGAARLLLYPGAPPTGVAAVTLDQLHLDTYLAAPMQRTPEAPPGAPSTAWPDQPDRADPPLPEPAAGLLVVSMDGDNIRAGGLLYREATVLARLDVDGWTAEIEAADFYGGALDARATRLRAAGPAGPIPLTLSATAEDIDVGALLAETTGEAQLSGRGRVELDLVASAGSPAMIRESLGGTLAMAIEDGALTGLDLKSLLGAAVGRDAAGTGGQPASLTDFATLTASARGEKGLFRSDDIRARSPLVHIDGRGAVDVVAETLALDLQAVLVEPPSGAGMRELEGIPIPIDVSGPWHHPQWQVDVGPALRQAARRALDKKLREENDVLQQLEERTGIPLREGLERGLRGLFGQ
jgi:AsmA protein